MIRPGRDGVGLGLSPRVRGNPWPWAGFSCGSGSIPACAGEPRRQRPRQWVCRVYPRVCGGTRRRRGRRARAVGLSPRVRGNLGHTRLSSPLARSIPACAGEPAVIVHQDGVYGVYPRVCGGTLDESRYCRAYCGLSPRVRGNPSLLRAGRSRRWSIPACAGEPCSSSHSWTTARVYPRVCGGTSYSPAPILNSRGLSPRVRGNLAQAAQASNSAGSIPACAGEPCGRWTMLWERWVYPRVCGGTRYVQGWGNDKEGLSPRVRGNHDRNDTTHQDIGSIPACAGEPW